MVRTIDQADLHIHNGIASQNAGLHSALDTGIDSGNIFLGNSAADNSIDELVTLAGFVGLNGDLNMTVLALTAGLTLVLFFVSNSLADGFTISNLRCANVCFHLELAEQTVHDDFQVQLAHAGDDGLAGFLIRPSAEGGVFFSQLCQSDAHLLAASLGLGLDSNADNGIGEVHGLQNDGMILITQSITGGGVLQAHSSGNVACIAGFQVGAVVSVHLHDTAHTLVGVFAAVVHGGTCIDLTGVNTEEGQLTHERVSSDLKCQCCEGAVVVCMTLFLFIGLRIGTLDSGHIQGRRHIVNDCIQQLLNALVAVRRTAGHRNDRVVDGSLAQCLLDLFLGQLTFGEVLFHQSLVGLCDSLHQLAAVLFGLSLHIGGNVFHADIVAHIVVVDVSLHVDQVDDTLEGILSTDGQLNGNSVALQAVMEHIQAALEVCTHDVHLVDIHHAGNMILVSLTPNGFRLGLNAALSAQNGHRTVQHTQGALHLNGEVHVARGINDVDTVLILGIRLGIVLSLSVRPVAGGSSRSNGNTTLLLLCHPVHRSGTLVRFTDLVVNTGVVQDSLGGGGLTCVDVGHNADVSGHFQRNVSRHGFKPPSTQISSGNVQRHGLPRPSCEYPHAS